MTDLILTIENEEDLTIEPEGSDSDEEITIVSKKQRTQKKLEKKGFNPDFQFEDDGFYETKWTLESALHNALKQKKIHTTLDQKIDQVRRKQYKPISHEKPEDVDDLSDQLEDENEVENVGKIKTDKINLINRKRKRNANAEEDDSNLPVPLAEIQDSSGGDKNMSWDPTLGFQEMNLSRPLLKSISEINYVTPTPIQQAAIPVGLLGRDISACAATGTGKTAAFMLPVLERLLYRPQSSAFTRVLCLVPTRELAVQVYSVTQQLAQHSSIRICLAAGGLDIKTQEAALRQGPDIVIATPGRLIDHLHNTPSFDLHLVEILILDEADRMLDEFFEDQMNEIIKLCSHQRQTMLFSATMSEQVQELAAVSLKNPVKIFVNSNTDVAPYLKQEFIRIRPNREGDREAIVAALCSRSFISNVLVFTQTKKQAHRMHIVLGLLGLKAGELHGDLSQTQRLEGLRRFKNEDVDILVCTDLAARGLDIENVKTVINLTMPNTHQHYVHRVGRTARAGKSGRSVSLVGESERKLLKEIVKFAKNQVKSRVVPAEVVNKFADKLKLLENEVGEVMQMEAQEKTLLAQENQLKKAEKIVKGEAPEKRNWFQSKIEREMSRAERMLGSHSKVPKKFKKTSGKKGPSAPTTADARVEVELRKTREFQKRQLKRNRKEKRTRACAEPIAKVQNVVKSRPKKKSSFDAELTNTSKRKNAKHRNIKQRRKFKR
uniref:RNA helicase n=1 Tax=Phallusia mammillata TaxID=59560 RepID=A0A6F9DB99_9ASCI|nr:probable ATP-dependent RNA helicase DDX27 [Phallusia mammillata]